MSASTIVSQPVAFLGLTASQADQALAPIGLQPWRGRQLRDWIYRKHIADPSQMTTFSQPHQTLLAQAFSFAPATLLRRQDSADGVIKLLLQWQPGHVAETVLIPDGPRRTACISSQVGCPVGCRFCASGLAGVKANLTAAQIVEQVYQLNLIQGSPDNAITNVVFMGMGEPLANYAAVLQAIRVLHDPGCLNLSARRITLSTVGLPQRIRDLAHEQLPINLAISLHAPTEDLRRRLIPWAEHFSLDQILDAARDYFSTTGREITLEYILLASVNDQPQHARQLAALCKTLRANVNLIHYNPVAGLEFQRPNSDDVLAFQRILRDAGVNAHIRKSRGRDIDAACGQLRRKQQENQ